MRRLLRRPGDPVVAGITSLLFITTALVWSPGPTMAQQYTTETLTIGDRIKVLSPDAGAEAQEFIFQGRQKGSLFVSEPDVVREIDGVERLSALTVEQLQVRRKNGSHARVGAGFGIVVGALAGYLTASDRCSDNTVEDFDCTGLVFFAHDGLIGIASGAIVGGIIGLSIPKYNWVPIEVRPEP